MYRRLVAFALAVTAVAVLVMLVPLTLAARANVRSQNLAAVADQARRVADSWERGSGNGSVGITVAESGKVEDLEVDDMSDDADIRPVEPEDSASGDPTPAATSDGSDSGPGSSDSGSGSSDSGQGSSSEDSGSDGSSSSGSKSDDSSDSGSSESGSANSDSGSSDSDSGDSDAGAPAPDDDEDSGSGETKTAEGESPEHASSDSESSERDTTDDEHATGSGPEADTEVKSMAVRGSGAGLTSGWRVRPARAGLDSADPQPSGSPAVDSATRPPFPLQGGGPALADPDQVTLISPSGEIVGPPVPPEADALVEEAAHGRSGTLDVGSAAYAAAPSFLAGGSIGVVLVSATADQMGEGLAPRMAAVAGLALALLGAAGLAGWWLARRTAAPIRALADTADQLASGDLAARAAPSAIPEVSDVSVALNRMAQRTAELLADERAANAELAHQLRTPLTVLTADIDAVADPTVRERLAADALALARTTDEIINTARRSDREGLRASCDAAAVVRQRLEFWAVLADYQDRRITSAIPDTAQPVRLTEYDLTTAVDILLQNVFVHTPDGVGLAVIVRPGGQGTIELEVSDDGQGFPEVPPERTGSTQLGLAIAERLAIGSGGSLARSASPSGGARVTLVLGRSVE